MNTRAVATLGIAALLILPTGRVRAQGLYDTGTNKTTGDLVDQDYWWARFDHEMLDLCLSQHQPEGRIDVQVGPAIRRLDDLIKKYPKHEDLPKWRARAVDVDKKVNPNANRGTAFNAGCPWEEANYGQLWVNWHYARMLLDDKNYELAFTMLTNVMQNYDIMLKPDRMKDYPDDLRAWVVNSKPEADKMFALAKAKTHRG